MEINNEHKKKINKIAINLKLFYNHLLGYTLIYPPQGMGDILILALGMEEYKKINNNPKVAFIVHKKHFVNLCRIFSENIDKIIFINKTPKKMPKYVINVSDRTYGVQSHFDRFETALLDAIGINKELSSFQHPKIRQFIKIEQLFKNTFIKGKTVLITPEATTSLNCVPNNYWITLADKLKTKGYIPVFNSKRKYGEYENILLPLEETINFADLAGNVLGLRSGINDVLACFSSAYQVIIYPNNWQKGDMPYLNGFDEDPNKRYMEDGSLSRLYPNKKFVEFIYDERIDPTSFFGRITYENI